MASSFVKLVCMANVCFIFGASSLKAQAAVTCGQVVSNMIPCVSFIRNGGNIVPVECCNGIRSLSNLARTTQDRQSVCNCIKNAIKGIPYNDFNLGLASCLPKKCGINIPYQISLFTDCNRVH